MRNVVKAKVKAQFSTHLEFARHPRDWKIQRHAKLCMWNSSSHPPPILLGFVLHSLTSSKDPLRNGEQLSQQIHRIQGVVEWTHTVMGVTGSTQCLKAAWHFLFWKYLFHCWELCQHWTAQVEMFPCQKFASGWLFFLTCQQKKVNGF